MYVNAQIPVLDKMTDAAVSENHEKTCSFLSQHGLVPTPVNYLVAYVHTLGDKPELSNEISHHEEQGTTLDRFQLRDLFDRNLQSVAEDQCAAMFFQANTMVAETIGKLGDAGSGLGDFDSVLSEQQQALKATSKVEDITRVAQALATATEKAHSETKGLQSDLAHVQQEAEELREELERLKYESQTDGLTGLLNRKALETVLGELDSGDSDEFSGEYSLLMMDIDHFKSINDTYGHLLGDQVIRKVAQTIKNGVRGNDIVVRYGGEEYLVLLPDTPAAGAAVVSESIRTSIEKLRLVEKKTDRKIPPFTISIGIASRKAEECGESVIERADQALYCSKQNGRNRFTTEEMLVESKAAEDTALSEAGL